MTDVQILISQYDDDTESIESITEMLWDIR